MSSNDNSHFSSNDYKNPRLGTGSHIKRYLFENKTTRQTRLRPPPNKVPTTHTQVDNKEVLAFCIFEACNKHPRSIPAAAGLVRYKGLADGQTFNTKKQETKILPLGHICNIWNKILRRPPAVKGLVSGKGLATGITFNKA